MRESAIEIACNLPARYLSIFDQIVHDGTVPTLLLSLILWANIAFCNKQKHTLESDHGSVLSSYLVLMTTNATAGGVFHVVALVNSSVWSTTGGLSSLPFLALGPVRCNTAVM